MTKGHLIMGGATALALSLAAGPARAQFDLGRLETVAPQSRQLTFNSLMREMAMAVAAGSGNGPVGTLGLDGFELGFELNTAFIRARQNDPAGDSTGWQVVTGSINPLPVWLAPTLRIRKGLPYSFEVGGNFSYLVNTGHSAIGGYVRWALQEGWRPIPDFSITIGYIGYVGDDQLDLGVLETDLKVGYSLGIGSGGENSGRFSPFVGYGFLQSHARPKNLSFDLAPVTAFNRQAVAGTDTRDFRFHKLIVGFELLFSGFSFAIDGEIVGPNGVHSVNFRLGGRF